MPPPIVIPDASVLLKWVLQAEDEGDRARAEDLKESWLSGACHVLVPSLWIYEVGNILGLKRPTEARDLLQAMVDLELEEQRPEVYMEDIYRLIRKYKITFYDAAYHALAIHTGGVFLTADSAYARKTSQAGHIRELKDWRPREISDPKS